MSRIGYGSGSGVGGRLAAGAGVAAVCGALAVALAACQGGGPARETVSSSPRQAAPLALTRPVERPASALMPLDEPELRRAIEAYMVNRQREPGSYRLAGADLDGDGAAEAIVLFDGEDWCAPTGCSMTVFKAGERGYRALFRTVRVKAPVIVGEGSHNGWRHLYVMTGGGAAPLKRVQLRFGDRGYPANALLEPEVPARAEVAGEVAIDAEAGPAAAQAARSR